MKSLTFMLLVVFMTGSVINGVIRKPGYCSVKMQYALFQPNNIPAPVVTGDSLERLTEMCPYLVGKQKQNVHACCDSRSLLYIKESFRNAQNIFSECPSCLKNIYSIWCELLCSPNQSLHVRRSNWGQASFYVTEKFANDLQTSCRDVQFPGITDKATSLICDSNLHKCNYEKFMNAMNFQLSAMLNFAINQNASAMGIVNNDKKMIRCNESFPDFHTGKLIEKCSCENCRDSCAAPKILDNIELFIRSKVPVPADSYHPYQSGTPINFTGAIHKEIFQKVLKLQQALTSLTVTDQGKEISFDDICYKPNKEDPHYNSCAVYSPLQYWGLSEKNLEKCSTNMLEDCDDPRTIGLKAEDWHDQFLKCTRTPASRTYFLQLSCWSKFGVPIHPKHVLEEYDMDNYNHAKTLKVKFVFNSTTNDQQRLINLWKTKFSQFLDQWIEKEAPKENLNIIYHLSK